MKINELEKMLGLSKANIRYYESEGLITPNRTENGYRNYSDADAQLLKKIIVYRKLGIPISEIKSVLNNDKTLNDVIKSSIKDMESDIDTLNVAIEICEEIKNKNIEDANFDTDYFWNEINNREINGNEFIDIGNIDITPFKNKKVTKAFIIVFAILFFFGIAYSFFCNYVFIADDNNDYKTTVSEVKTADTIDTVKVDAQNGLIYVCYIDATCVNTYDFEGNFKWAVSVPQIKAKGYTYFYLIENKLYIDNEDDVFVYDSTTGKYIERTYADELGLVDERDNFETYHQDDINRAKECGITFDAYNVYITTKDNEQFAFVNKPLYVLLENYAVGWIIAFIGGIGLAIIAFISKIKIVKSLEFNNEDISKMAKAHRIFNFVLMAMFMIFAVLNLIFAIFDLANIRLGIFPATALFIASFIVSDITKKHYNDSEYKFTATVFHYLVISYVVLFISLLISIFFN